MGFSMISTLLADKQFLEFLRLGIVYSHLIACCVAIGSVVTSDIAMVRQLFKAERCSERDAHDLTSLQKTVSWSLLMLWVTGFAIIGIDLVDKGLVYFENPKLQAKIAVVMLLTLNGFVLHSAVLPAVQRVGSLLDLSVGMRTLAVFSGAFSAVSWFYAAMLGVGRPLAWKYSLLELMAAYPLLIVVGFISMMLLTQWSKKTLEARENGWDKAPDVASA
ncbi:hypothetical protein NVV94_12605 [Pseudomonas sp. LS1212]|uniref:hypothetical protein n=1 Tax=Pseudomonas sp. LS1212 TaxID=2972478 RepID=UPI00215B9575|nr:hypothetical protein [Pseudomonas sp. LS1212]UVJ46295.1 hypothetical protein NVV94_12605 [Pseudomonas sp. LS1212]